MNRLKCICWLYKGYIVSYPLLSIYTICMHSTELGHCLFRIFILSLLSNIVSSNASWLKYSSSNREGDEPTAKSSARAKCRKFSSKECIFGIRFRINFVKCLIARTQSFLSEMKKSIESYFFGNRNE